MRKRYIALAKQHNYKVAVLIMPFMTKKDCVDRRMKNPHNCPDRKIWESVWDKFNKQYQEPSLTEGIDKIIKLKNE